MLDKLNQFLKVNQSLIVDNQFPLSFQNNEYYEVPQKKERSFIVAHYAGKVKYQIEVSLLSSEILERVFLFRVSERRTRI